jgi:hypothetical protein
VVAANHTDNVTGAPEYAVDQPGLYDTTNRMVLISVNHTPDGSRIATNHGSRNVVLHETGHAIDDILSRPSAYGLRNENTIRTRMTQIFVARHGQPTKAERQAIVRAAQTFRNWVRDYSAAFNSAAAGFRTEATRDGLAWAMANPEVMKAYPIAGPTPGSIVTVPGKWGDLIYMGVSGAATPDDITASTQFGLGLGGGSGTGNQQAREIFAEFGTLFRLDPVQAQAWFPNTSTYWNSNIANSPHGIGGPNYPRVPTR